MFVGGHLDPATEAWLCPSDPGPGETTGAAGRARFLDFGCLDLGTSDPKPGATGWEAEFDLRALPADRLGAFTPGGTYHLLLVNGDEGGSSTFSTDVPPLSLVP